MSFLLSKKERLFLAAAVLPPEQDADPYRTFHHNANQ
jgi:hypothetical protein